MDEYSQEAGYDQAGSELAKGIDAEHPHLEGSFVWVAQSVKNRIPRHSGGVQMVVEDASEHDPQVYKVEGDTGTQHCHVNYVRHRIDLLLLTLHDLFLLDRHGRLMPCGKILLLFPELLELVAKRMMHFQEERDHEGGHEDSIEHIKQTDHHGGGFHMHRLVSKILLADPAHVGDHNVHPTDCVPEKHPARYQCQHYEGAGHIWMGDPRCGPQHGVGAVGNFFAYKGFHQHCPAGDETAESKKWQP
mmetsp:Transcript_27463/g.78911  ORF Transcript_27463/g.78911 Transcript_27463/m.78911 type:complete len:246 (+) Transcript_27463:1069-1806(+)